MQAVQPQLEDLSELEALLTGFWLTDLANFAAYVATALPDINWLGFYLNDGTKLRLGPFWGRPACTEIDYQRGVCGAAFREKRTLIVDDVDQFPGHIVCDSASRSEIVIPFFVDGMCLGVLDIDSPRLARFTSADQKRLESAVAVLVAALSRGSGAAGGAPGAGGAQSSDGVRGLLI